MKHNCERCGEQIQAGNKVVQMRHGLWTGAITPQYAELIAEWHNGDGAECFNREFVLNPQRLPYKCEECKEPVRLSERISFLIIGSETDEDWSTAEGRGYELYTVKHYPACPKQ